MPTNQPSNAPTDLEPKEETTPAAVLSDEALGMPAGGGGLNGTSAQGQPSAPAGTSPNSPIDVPLPKASQAGQTSPSVEAEARRQATAQPPTSR